VFRNCICRENGNHNIEGIHWHTVCHEAEPWDTVMKFLEQLVSVNRSRKTVYRGVGLETN